MEEKIQKGSHEKKNKYFTYKKYKLVDFLYIDMQMPLNMSLSMGTHDLRFLHNIFANLRFFFDVINIINDDIISGVLLSFSAL